MRFEGEVREEAVIAYESVNRHTPALKTRISRSRDLQATNIHGLSLCLCALIDRELRFMVSTHDGVQSRLIFGRPLPESKRVIVGFSAR